MIGSLIKHPREYPAAVIVLSFYGRSSHYIRNPESFAMARLYSYFSLHWNSGIMMALVKFEIRNRSVSILNVAFSVQKNPGQPRIKAAVAVLASHGNPQNENLNEVFGLTLPGGSYAFTVTKRALHVPALY